MHGTFLEARTCSLNNKKYAGSVYLVCPKNADSVRWRYYTFNQPMPPGYADWEKYPPCCWTWEDDLLQQIDEINLPSPGAVAAPLGRPGFEAVLPKQLRVLYRAIEGEIVLDPETEHVEGPAAPLDARPDTLSALLARHQESGPSLADDAPPPQARRRSLRPCPPFHSAERGVRRHLVSLAFCRPARRSNRGRSRLAGHPSCSNCRPPVLEEVPRRHYRRVKSPRLKTWRCKKTRGIAPRSDGEFQIASTIRMSRWQDVSDAPSSWSAVEESAAVEELSAMSFGHRIVMRAVATTTNDCGQALIIPNNAK